MSRHKSALGTGRNDNRILDHLRLDQAEYFGAKILGAIGPSQATSRDGTKPQVGSGHSWRVDENLKLGPRGRGKAEIGRTDLEGQRPSTALPPVRTDHSPDDGMHHA